MFTIIDKNSEKLQEKERDLVSLHNEMPKYFSKPRLFDQSLPEVIKTKKNMMFALKAIKNRELKIVKRKSIDHRTSPPQP